MPQAPPNRDPVNDGDVCRWRSVSALVTVQDDDATLNGAHHLPAGVGQLIVHPGSGDLPGEIGHLTCLAYEVPRTATLAEDDVEPGSAHPGMDRLGEADVQVTARLQSLVAFQTPHPGTYRTKPALGSFTLVGRHAHHPASIPRP